MYFVLMLKYSILELIKKLLPFVYFSMDFPGKSKISIRTISYEYVFKKIGKLKKNF